MMDNLLIARWNLFGTDGDAAAGTIQFYKDGSCIVPAVLIGGEGEYLYYQAYENGTIRFEPAEGMAIYRYQADGDALTLQKLSGEEFRFVKEGKKAVKKPRPEGGAKSDKVEPEREPSEFEWKCPRCGKINQNYVGTCGCGEAIPIGTRAYEWEAVHPELAEKPEPEAAPAEEPKPEKKAKAEKVEPERQPSEFEWKCPKCGKINQNYVGTCGCGEAIPVGTRAYEWEAVHPELAEKPVPEAAPAEEPKPEKKAKAKEVKPEPERVPTENEWKCPRCGKINQNYVGTCGCGEGKPVAPPAQG